MTAMTRVYLDWNATAPLRPQARAAVLAALEVTGNPSSVHGEGRAARRMIEAARAEVAALVGAEPRNVVFTSGGTEANMLALSPATGAGRDGAPCGRLLVSAIEHPSVLAGGRFPSSAVEQVPASADGRIDLAALERRLAALASEASGQRGDSMVRAPDTRPEPGSSARAALASEASGQRGDSMVRAHSALEDARERADDTRPEPGSSARAGT